MSFKTKTKFNSYQEFLNPSEGKYVIVPNGFGCSHEINLNNIHTIKCPIFNCMKKSNNYKLINKDNSINLNFLMTYDKFIYFTSLIYKYHIRQYNQFHSISHLEGMISSEVPTVFFHMSSGSDTSLISKMLGMSKPNVQKMLNFFIEFKFLEVFDEHKYYIDWTKGENLSDRKARDFVVSQQFFRKPVKYFFKSDVVINNLNEKINFKLNSILSSDAVINFENVIMSDEVIQSMTFPTEEHLLEVAKTMVDNKIKDKYGREYVWSIPEEWMSEDNGNIVTKKKKSGSGTYTYVIRGKIKENCPYVDISKHIWNYVLVMEGDKLMKQRNVFEENGEKFYDRFYSTLSLLPKWIRNEIKLNEEDIVEVDAMALHPQILGNLFTLYSGLKVPDFLIGDSHSKIAKLLNINRSEAKLLNLSYWNSKITKTETIASKKNKVLFNFMDNFLKEYHNELFDFLKEIKLNRNAIKGRRRHSNMSVMLIDKEVRIMQDVINDIQGVPFIYVYDAIYVPKSKENDIKEILRRNIERHLVN